MPEREGRTRADRRGRRAQPEAGRGQGRGVPENVRVERARRWTHCPAASSPSCGGRWACRSGDIAAEIERSCGDDAFDLAGLREIAAMNANWGTKSGLARAEAIATWLTLPPGKRAQRLADLHSVWATAKGEPRSFGKGQAPQEPGYARYRDAAARSLRRAARDEGPGRIRRPARARAGGGAGLCRHLCAGQAPRGRSRLRRSDPRVPSSCSDSRAWANGCATSSIR